MSGMREWWSNVRYRWAWWRWFWSAKYGHWDLTQEPVPAYLREVITQFGPPAKDCPTIDYVVRIAQQKEDAHPEASNHLFMCPRCGHIAIAAAKRLIGEGGERP